MDKKVSSSHKIEFLEGLRGLFAINVIINHFIVVYYPQMYYLDFANKENGFLSLFASTPLSVLVNGNIAVQFFFVLTGFLVGRMVFTREISTHTLREKIVKRYTRLLPIVVAATVFTAITMFLSIQYHHYIVNDVKNGGFLAAYCNFEPSVFSTLFNAFIKTFFGTNDYVGPFWVMKYEFLGYIFVMLLCYILKDSSWRRVGCIIGAVFLGILFDLKYSVMVFGAFVAELYYNNTSDASKFSKYYCKILDKKWFLCLCFVLGLYFACCPMEFTSVYKFLSVIPVINTGFIRGVGMALIVFVMLKVKPLRSFFELRFFKWLGKFSFAVYAFHWPIMLTLQAYLFSLFLPRLGYDWSALASFFVTLPIIYAFSYLMWHILESGKFTESLKNKLLKKT